MALPPKSKTFSFTVHNPQGFRKEFGQGFGLPPHNAATSQSRKRTLFCFICYVIYRPLCRTHLSSSFFRCPTLAHKKRDFTIPTAISTNRGPRAVLHRPPLPPSPSVTPLAPPGGVGPAAAPSPPPRRLLFRRAPRCRGRLRPFSRRAPAVPPDARRLPRRPPDPPPVHPGATLPPSLPAQGLVRPLTVR